MQEKKTIIQKNIIKYKQIKPKLKLKQQVRTMKQKKPLPRKKLMLTNTNGLRKKVK